LDRLHLSSTNLTLTFTVTHTGSNGDVITNTAYFSDALYLGSANAIRRNPIFLRLTVGYVGNGDGTVQPTPSARIIRAGTVVTLRQCQPDVSLHSWSGDVISTTNPLIVMIDGDKTIAATFITHRIYLPLVLK
jgi:hypothetical protein